MIDHIDRQLYDPVRAGSKRFKDGGEIGVGLGNLHPEIGRKTTGAVLSTLA